MATKKVEPAQEDIMGSVMSALIQNDPEFHKFAAKAIKDGTAPLLTDATPKGNEGAATPGKTNKDSIFFKGNAGKVEGVDTKEKFDALVKEKFNMDVATDGYDKFLNTVNKFREDSQKTADLQKQVTGIQNSYKALPPAVKKSIEAFTQGHNWKEAFNLYASKLDYTKKADDYKAQDLASYYFPAKIAKAKVDLDAKTIDQTAFDSLVETYQETAITKFDAEKNLFEVSRKEVARTAQIQQDNFTKSIDTAFEKFKQKFTDFDETRLAEVRSHLENGLESLFFQEDGTLKDDAAIKLTMALYGEQELELARKDASNDTALEIIDGALKDPKLTPTGGAPNGKGTIDQDTKILMETMSGGVKDPYTVKTKHS